IELQVGSETGGEIVNNAANIILDGSNANTSFVDDNGHALLALAANTTATSGLTIENGYNLTTPAAFSNAGSVTVGTASGDTSTLKIGASGTSAYTQSTAAALTQGTGTIMGNVTVSNGTIAPGSTTTAGTLTISGNYGQSGGTFTDVLGASSNGLLNVGGTAGLSGTAALNIVLGSGFVATDGTQYTIMTGHGGLSGQFVTGASGAEFQEDGYNWTIGYSGGNAVLDLINAVGSGPADVTATWTAGTGAWTTASLWSCSPGPATCVPNNTSNDVYETVLNSPTHTLTLASGNAFAVNTLTLTAGTLDIASGASLNLVNQASGLTDIGQSAGLILGGTLTVNGATNGLAQLGSVEGTLELANGASTATTPASGTLTVSSTGSIDVQQGSTLAVTGNLTNSGAINTGNGSSDTGHNSLQVSGALTNASAGSSINLSAAHDSISATTLSNAGSIGFNAANQSLTTTGSASNSGQLVFNSGSNGSTASIGGAFDNTNTVSMVGASDTLSSGSYSNASGAHTTVGASETLNAGSSLTNNGTLTLNGGTVSTSSLSNSAVIVGGGSLGATNATLTNNSGGSIATSGSGQTLALSGNLTSAGTLSTVAGSTISVTGQAESSGSVSLAGTLSAGNGVVNDSTGAVTLSGGTVAASFSNNGSVTGAGTIGTGPSVDASNGVLGTITPNGTVTFAVNNLTNEGTVNVTSGNTLNFTSNSGSMSNYGSVAVASGGTVGLASGMIYSQGSGTTTANGAFGGSAASLTISGGTLQGTGTITGTTNINSGGTLVAGNGSTPGTLTITGELSISGTMGLNASSATNYGVVDVSGALTLNSGSTLNLSNLDALNLAVGKTLTIATSGSAVGGTFANITGDTYDSGARGWNVLYNEGGDNVELTSISLANLAQPSAATPNPINFGNVRVGAAPLSQALTISNQATAPADGLNASISTATAGLTASGSFSGLAPGATNNTSLVVGMNTATAGSRNGTATVALVSNGSTTGSPTTLPSQTINVTGGVYETAQPSLPSSVNLGNFHVGTSSLSQAVAISNPYASGVPGGYQEGLDVASGATTGQATISGGPITNLAAGNSSSSISVGLSGLAAGVNSGAATVGLASDGATTSGLSMLSLGNSAINVSATGYNLASGSTTPSPVTIGNQRVGGSNSQVLTVANSAPSGAYTEV
ncbi:MAG: choice-of-anchor D domain-containing protein, partial [Steroidobacteraceae bacterium]